MKGKSKSMNQRTTAQNSTCFGTTTNKPTHKTLGILNKVKEKHKCDTPSDRCITWEWYSNNDTEVIDANSEYG